MKKLFLLIILSSFISNFFAMSQTKQPDFAYPKTVSADAEKLLKKAIKADNTQATVDALIQYSLAQTSISPDNASSVVDKIESVITSCNNPTTISLLQLLQAQIYTSYYQGNSFNLRLRTTSANPGNDISQWSGDNFRDKVIDLCRQATDNTSLCYEPIANYSDIIIADSQTRLFYPTLYDFACSQAISRLQTFDESIAILSPTRLSDTNPIVLANSSSPATSLIFDIYNRWLAANPRPTAARISVLMARYQAVCDASIDFSDTPMLQSAASEALYKNLLELYRKNSDTPYAIELLLDAEACDAPNYAIKSDYYKALTDFANAHPDYFNINAVSQQINRLSAKYCRISSQQNVGRNHPFTIKVTSDNCNSGVIVIYRIAPSTPYNYQLGSGPEEKVAEIPFTIEGAVPFHGETTIQATLDQYGCYIAYPVFDGSETRNYQSIIHCSDLAYMICNKQQQANIFTVNAISGQRQGDVDISIYQNGRNAKTVNAKSNADGIAKIDVPFYTGDFTIKKGDDIYFAPENFSATARRSDQKSTAASLRTSLPIYHPGDTVDFVGVLYTYSASSSETLPGTNVGALLINANNQPIDTLDLVTDHMGRLSGSFKIPDEGLTGNFYIAITSGDNYRRRISSGSFMVSDYKLPTYTLSAKATADGSDIVISGVAKTYSDFPVANADITLRLSVAGHYYFFNNPTGTEILTATAKTAADGSFEIRLSPEQLALSPLPNGYFIVNLISTSPSGENQMASTAFTLGKSHIISQSIPANILATADNSFSISLLNLAAEPIEHDLTLTFSSVSTTKSITARSVDGQCHIGALDIPSGQYTLTISAGDLADDVTKQIVVYRTTDKTCAVANVPLWVPQTSINAPIGSAAKLMFESDIDGADIAMMVSTNDSLVDLRWIKSRRGVNYISLPLAANVRQAKVQLSAIRDFTPYQATINVNVKAPAEGLKFSIQSFRDRAIPQSQETFTFKTTDNSGTGRNAAVVLNIYAKALTTLQSFSPFCFRDVAPRYYSIHSFTPSTLQAYSYISQQSLSTIDIAAPTYNYYGRSFDFDSGRGYMLGATTRLYASRALGASPMADADFITEETDEVAATDSGQTVDDQAADSTPVDNQDYRLPEVPLALFAPILDTDDNGNLSVSFTVPNANTTWVLDALAFDSSLDCATLSRDIIASKPVMVQPNLPRFLRRGDNATILCSVMNNSEADSQVTTVIEIADAATGSVINSYSSSDFIAAGAATIVATDINPIGTSALQITVRSTLGNFSDGERAIIPILSDSQLVIDSQTFYLGNNDSTLNVDLNPARKDASTVLSYCQNPTWSVVTALPGLLETQSQTSPAQAARIFSAAVAVGLLRSNPSVANDLQHWLETSDDNELTSMLNKNEDLKQLLLASTPWVNDAASDTERMTRLALLFDKKTVNKTIADAINALKKLECNGGGWAWSSYLGLNEASEWATYTVLNTLGELQQLGFTPYDSGLKEMIDRALKYIDTQIADTYAKYPKGDYTFYTYTRRLFSTPLYNTTAQKAISVTEQNLLKNWKKYSVDQKAIAAIILNKNYHNVCLTILESLRQFASVSNEQGMWWDSVKAGSWWSMERNGRTAIILRAFNTVDPTCADIDLIRQWLILNKQLQDWGSSVSTTETIAGLLSCGSNWLTIPAGLNINVDGLPIDIDVADRLTGAFITNIPASASNLKINRSDNGPAWGAVLARYDAVMTEIQPQSVDGLSISKEILVRRGDSFVATDSLSIGDVAKVRLVINAVRDMDYVTIVDQRAAALQPVIQTPRNIYCDGLVFYLENRDAQTNLFINRLHKGQFVIEYEMNVNNAGRYSAGIATIQSQYAPEMTAHSAGATLVIDR
jgi:hypothetical protein